MTDRRRGMYYVPNEGMRFWDGEEWAEEEPPPEDSERPNAPHTVQASTVTRRAGRKGVLPWVVAGITGIAVGVLATLLVIGGVASEALASTSEAIAALVSAKP